jgi:hypothetical protein
VQPDSAGLTGGELDERILQSGSVMTKRMFSAQRRYRSRRFGSKE